MKKGILTFVALLLLNASIGIAQKKSQTVKPSIKRVEPPFWYTGFKDTTLSLLVYGPNIASLKPEIRPYPGVALFGATTLDNPNYLFLDIAIGPKTNPGTIEIVFGTGKSALTYKYVLNARNNDPLRAQGFGPQDMIYLLVPDRFANGDPNNDSVEGMLEKADRSHDMGRHGGDIKGIANNLDYIIDLGMTAVWFTPILENDMTPEYRAYHGYAATDLYKVDRRFGSNQEYLDLIDLCHKKGLKVIMDMIHNHVGDQHWWMKDKPSNDWFTSLSDYGVTNFRGEAASDPYASKYDADRLTKAWFVKAMPDLNTSNRFLADYLIQNSIWWIEYAGIDGIRMDTYVYPDKVYMAEWVAAVHREFERFNIVGEVWVQTVPSTAYYTIEARTNDGYKGTLRSITDFPLYAAMTTATWEGFGWTTGISRVYYTLTQDFLYKDPRNNVIFVDNHDLWRFGSHVNKDVKKFNLGMTMLFTLRGIPQVYYGTEHMMDSWGEGNHDAVKRKDFPGGWPGDPVNKFIREGRTPEENQVFDFIKTLANYRKKSQALTIGRMTHFVPEDNVYVYFRYAGNEEVLVMLNFGDKDKTVDMKRFQERSGQYSRGRNVISGDEVTDLKRITVPAFGSLIIELQK